MSVWKDFSMAVGRWSLFLPMCNFVDQSSSIQRSSLGLNVVGNAIERDDDCRFRFQSLSQEISNATSWTLR